MMDRLPEEQTFSTSRNARDKLSADCIHMWEVNASEILEGYHVTVHPRTIANLNRSLI